MAAMDDYIAEYAGICQKLENGRDVCNLMTGFWKQLAKIEQAYAKQLSDLCSGRFGRLQRLFGSTGALFGGPEAIAPGSLEHIGSLQDCWLKVMGEVEKLADEHKQLGQHIVKKVTPAIEKFTREKMTDQAQAVANGKRALGEVRSDFQRVTATKRKFFAEVAARRDRGESVGEGGEQTPAELAYRAAVSDASSRYTQVFDVSMPGVMKDINTIEQDRAQMLCSCMNQYTQGAAKLKESLTFDATAAALEATTKDQTVTQLIMVTEPPPAPEVEPPTEENVVREREEAQAQSLVTTMSGWLRRDPSSSEPAKPAAESKPQEGSSSSSSVGGRLASLFSGFGRKSTPVVATEPAADISGTADGNQSDGRPGVVVGGDDHLEVSKDPSLLVEDSAVGNEAGTGDDLAGRQEEEGREDD